MVTASSLAAPGGELERLRVVATILPAYCIAANVGGDAVETWYLASGGGDAHDYQLTPKDRSKIERSQILLVNGLGAEPWLEKVVNAARSLNVVNLSRGLEADLIRGPAAPPLSSRTETNIHVWLDPALMCRMVTNALRAFQQADPGRVALYEANAARYTERLRALDSELIESLKDVRGVSLVTFHDAFPYFARRYGLRVSGVIEEIPDLDPTPRHLSWLREKIRADHVPVIFVEPRHSRRLADRLGNDLGVKVGTLDTLETGTAIATAYEDGMKKNLQALKAALR